MCSRAMVKRSLNPQEIFQMNPLGSPPVIAIVGAGEMGVAVGRRLHEAGARILVSMSGRSASSADRVRRAGLEVAERLRTPLRNAASPPLFVDCNAIAPTTMHGIAKLLDPLLVIDAGIIGGPPTPGSQDPAAGPRFYASGPHAHRLVALTRYGL